MANRVFRYFVAAIFALLTSLVGAQEYPSPQNPPQLVNDFASLLTTAQKRSLEQKLVAFSDTTTVEIAVVTLKSLDGADIAMYATNLAHRWGIGDKDNDSGVLLLVKPKTATERGEVFIAVGYGLEGAIPDAAASQIVRDVIIPAFSVGDIYGGINNATTILMSLSSGEYSAGDLANRVASRPNPVAVFVVMFIIIAALNSLLRSRSNRSQTYTHGTTTTHVPPIFFGIPMSGGYRSGSSGGFGGSGFGGGGFGGFGGGGFGGGGAGGSW